MSEVSNTPRLRFPNYYDSYRKLTFGDIFKSLPTGMTPSRTKKEYFQGDIPWITSGELEYNEVYQTVESITEEAVNQTNLKVYPKGTFFIAITGLEAPGTRGRCAINAVPSTTNQSCMAFQENDKIINRFLFYWYLRYGVKLYFKYAQGSKQQSFNAGIVKSFELIIPSIPEQQKIADFLTTVDKRIELLEKKKTLLETYKKGVMKKIFNQEIRFKDDNGNYFPDWEEKKLGNIGEFKTSSVDKKLEDNQQKVFLVNYMNVYRHEKITNENTHNLMVVTAKSNQIESNNLLKGDILFTPSSETPDDIGHSVVIFEDLNNTLYSYHLLRFRPTIKIDILYSHYFCNDTEVLNQICRFAAGSTRFTISKESFSNILIKLPTLIEQSKIAMFLESIDKQIELLETQIDKSKTWKKGLLQKMFV